MSQHDMFNSQRIFHAQEVLSSHLVSSSEELFLYREPFAQYSKDGGSSPEYVYH